MELDPETYEQIRRILAKKCAIEITVAFYDESDKEETEEPVDLGTSLDFDEDATPEQRLAELQEALTDIQALLTGAVDLTETE